MFIWKIVHYEIATKDNLLKRRIDVNKECILCKMKDESPSHFFRDCEITRRVWKASNLGITPQQPETLPLCDWIKNYITYFIREDREDHSRLADFVCIMWSVWLHRNDCIFKSQQANPLAIMACAKN